MHLLPPALAAALLAASAAGLAPGPCEGTCDVAGIVVGGFLPPVLVVRSGATVQWHGLDGVAHVNEEGTAIAVRDTCFQAAYAGAAGGGAAFLVVEGGVEAVQGGSAKPCATAEPLPDGAWALRYQCVLHSATMNGALVVVP